MPQYPEHGVILTDWYHANHEEITAHVAGNIRNIGRDSSKNKIR